MIITLAKLLLEAVLPAPIAALPVKNIAIDSRLVKPGDLFLAYPGTTMHGGDYVTIAIAQGASAVLIDADYPNLPYLQEAITAIPLFPVKDLAQQISAIAGRFYQQPSHHLNVIGVTGTNGKTSTTHFIAQLLEQLGSTCGVMGTLGQGFRHNLQATGLTTSDARSIQCDLARFVEQGAKAVAMEVSSHGLMQQRVADVRFAVAVFTNLTQDHLDYHGTMQAYGAAKARLFTQPDLRYAVINTDDPFASELIAVLAKDVESIGYSLQTPQKNSLQHHVWLENIQYHAQGMQATLHSPWGQGELVTGLIGRFNLANVLAAISSVVLLGYLLPAVLAAAAHLMGVTGRMQRFGGKQQPMIVVDYAHTPDALAQALSSLQAHCKGRLFCIFGCGGDRDKSKRPLMAKAVAAHCDKIVVTNDNPRTEEPLAIITDILSGLTPSAEVLVETDREKAIDLVLQQAGPNDVILVAGKGHEDYQIIGQQRLPYSDIATVQRLLASKVR